jgi:hypothetical protein
MKNSLVFTLTVCAPLLVMGCGAPATAPAAKSLTESAVEPAASAPTQYAIQARKAEGGFAEVGRLLLQPGGQGALTVTATGPDADRLRKAWSEVSRRLVLTTKTRSAQGGLVGRDVPRGAPDYGKAVADVMSREFGYFLTEMPAEK